MRIEKRYLKAINDTIVSIVCVFVTGNIIFNYLYRRDIFTDFKNFDLLRACFNWMVFFIFLRYSKSGSDPVYSRISKKLFIILLVIVIALQLGSGFVYFLLHAPYSYLSAFWIPDLVILMSPWFVRLKLNRL